MRVFNNIIYVLFAVAVWVAVPAVVSADFLATEHFHVDSNYDQTDRENVEATLVKEGPALYFYVEKSWWDSQAQSSRRQVMEAFNRLSDEFDTVIYPKLTAAFGSERISTDTDKRIAVFFHFMRGGAQGYFRTTDGYERIQAPTSNEKKMLYMNISQMYEPQLKSFFAHEFTHLITFTQKEKIRGVQEETWLNEARAEYAITLLGYNTPYQGSNLQRRMLDFVQSSPDSLVEWLNQKSDYASINAFTHYLVDHYGVAVLTDSMKSNTVGIPSLNEALLKNGFTENFSQVFTNWVISHMVNDCSLGKKYCYLHPDLAGLRPRIPINFLPLSGEASLSVRSVSKNWMPDWQRIIGGNGNLQLTFEGAPGQAYQIPYVLFDRQGKAAIYSLVLGNNQSGTLQVPNFGIDYTSLVIAPFLKTNTLGFDNQQAAYPYSFTISVGSRVLPQEPTEGCVLVRNLSVGAKNNDVLCLQLFLKSQGAHIYPEGLATRYFGSLTKAAVIRFQETYRSEVLTPVGLNRGTGFVGFYTRSKINRLINAK